jgi:hypothetical protein
MSGDRPDTIRTYQCPNCGRMTSAEVGWLAWPSPNADFPTPYCDEPCQQRHYEKNNWTDRDMPQ